MALVKPDEIVMQSRGFLNLTWLRQIGLMIGLAASVAIGVAAAMWSQSPDYRLLYSNLSEQDAGEIIQTLQQAGIPYNLSSDSTTVMVPQKDVHNARLKLAGQGLPKGIGVGFELLEKSQGFGTSQFMENARYQRALEGELSRTISSINSVRSARVHLAIPKRSAFVRARKKPTASVTVDLYAGRSLNEGQVAAIGHMVAASIPDMEVDQVTIINQKGRLLTSPESSGDLRMASTHFEHRKRVEDYYISRIEDILTPIMGAGAVQAQVSADIDFTVTEKTRESYNPDLAAVRSEQTMEEKTNSPVMGGGIPGSLSNQPGTAKDGSNKNAQLVDGSDTVQQESEPISSSRSSTRNYELDKTISHIREGGATIRRLSVAVVVDDKVFIDEDGEVTKEPLADEEIERLTGLVKKAIGFDSQRGDSVSVVNSSFTVPQQPEELPEPSLLEGEGLWNILKQALVVGLIGFLLFGVLKPVMRELAAKGKTIPTAALPGGQAAGALSDDQLTLSGTQSVAQLGNDSGAYESNLNAARSLATQDPKRVAQVVNNWVVNE